MFIIVIHYSSVFPIVAQQLSVVYGSPMTKIVVVHKANFAIVYDLKTKSLVFNF